MERAADAAHSGAQQQQQAQWGSMGDAHPGYAAGVDAGGAFASGNASQAPAPAASAGLAANATAAADAVQASSGNASADGQPPVSTATQAEEAGLHEGANLETERTAEELVEEHADVEPAEQPAQVDEPAEENDGAGQEPASEADGSQAAGNGTEASEDGRTETADSAAGEEQLALSEEDDAEAAKAAEPEAPSPFQKGLEEFEAVPVPHSTMAEPTVGQDGAPAAGSTADLQRNATGTARIAGGPEDLQSEMDLDEAELEGEQDSAAAPGAEDEAGDAAASEGLHGAQQQLAQNLSAAAMEGLEERPAGAAEAQDAADMEAREDEERSAAYTGDAKDGDVLLSVDGHEAAEGSFGQAASLAREPEDEAAEGLLSQAAGLGLVLQDGTAPAAAESMEDEGAPDEGMLTEPLPAAEQLLRNDSLHATRDEL